MKKVLLLSALVGLLAVSCDTKTRLVEQIEGSWSSTPEQLQSTPGTQSTVVRVFDFERTPGKTEGTVTMKALITVDNAVGASETLTAPVSVTASGVATISGTYMAKDDDDLLVTLDYSTLNVSVDPQGVALDYNVLTQDSAPDLETLRPGAVRLVTQQITRAAQTIFSNVTEIEDIKINNHLMSCEIGHRDLTLRAVQP